MREEYMTVERLLSLFVILSLVVFLLLAGVTSCSETTSRETAAQSTVRVDYTDGVSCYHRGEQLSCLYVPSRAPYGPRAPATLPSDVLGP
jgi:hypothetical protein